MAAAGGSWKGGSFMAKASGPRANVIYQHADRQYQLFSDGERLQWGARTQKRSGRFTAWQRVESHVTLRSLEAGQIPGLPGGVTLKIARGG